MNPKPNSVHIFAIALLFALIGFSVWTSARAVDFGHYWDENPNYIRPLSNKLKQGNPLLPGRYIYPSLRYDLYLILTVPDALQSILSRSLSGTGLRTSLSERVQKPDFAMRGRAVGAILAHAILIWVAALTIIRGGNPLEGFLAAALVGLSWEFSYHSRWPIVDTLMSQFIALEMLCLTAAFKFKKHSALWIRLAVIASALACSSKYPGGLGLVPAVGAAFVLCRMRAFRFIFFLVQLVVLFTIVFVLTTPGAIFESSVFRDNIQFVGRIYATSGHGGYTINVGLEHYGRIMEYLILVCGSPYPILSFIIFGCCLLGLWTFLRQGTTQTLIYIMFPVLYVSYFGMQKVMIARNLLVLWPFVSVLAAKGIITIYRSLRHNLSRGIAITTIILFLTVNGFWIFQSSQSILERKQTNYVSKLITYIDNKSDARFVLSTNVQAALRRADGHKRSNVVDDLAKADYAVLYAKEVKQWSRWEANHRGNVTAIFGPRNVNLDYYPSWSANNHLIVLPASRAEKLGVFTVPAKVTSVQQ